MMASSSSVRLRSSSCLNRWSVLQPSLGLLRGPARSRPHRTACDHAGANNAPFAVDRCVLLHKHVGQWLNRIVAFPRLHAAACQ
jgi:hypothetical protein